MSHLSVVIDKIKEQYSTYENSSEIILDLQSQNNIAFWVNELASDRFDFNYTLSKELLDIFINNYANSCKDFYEIASVVAKKDGINDRALSKKLFTKALLKADLSSDYVKIAQKMIDENGFDNPNMAQELYIKAIEFAHNFYDYIDIANSIYTFDKEWAKDIYQKGEYKISSLGEFNKFISILKDIGDYEWAKKIVLKAVKEFKYVEDKNEFGTAIEKIELVEYICEENLLDDKELAKEIFDEIKHTFTDGYYTQIYNLIKNILKDDDMAEEWANDHGDQIENLTEEFDKDITKEDIENLLENEDDIFSNEDVLDNDSDSNSEDLIIGDDISELLSSEKEDDSELQELEALREEDESNAEIDDNSNLELIEEEQSNIDDLLQENNTEDDIEPLVDQHEDYSLEELSEDLESDEKELLAEEDIQEKEEIEECTVENIEDDLSQNLDTIEIREENLDVEEEQIIENREDSIIIDDNKDLNQLCEEQNNLSMLIMSIKEGKPISIKCDNRDFVIDSSDLDVRDVIKDLFFNKWNSINESIKSSIQ